MLQRLTDVTDVTDAEWGKGAFKLDECQYFGSGNPFTSENTDPVNDVADEWIDLSPS